MSKQFYSDLCGGFRELIELVGFDIAMEISRAFGGTNLYIPKPDSIDRIERNQQIVAEFNGNNYKALALKHDLTEQSIINIINAARQRATPLSVEDFIKDYE
jgi:Mor family transcriptional regulator